MKDFVTVLVILGVAGGAVYLIKNTETQNKKISDMEKKVADLDKKVTAFNAQKFIKEL